MSSNRYQRKSKCLSCRHIPCVNFYREAKGGKVEGGELKVLDLSIKVEKLLPCMPGQHLHACCKLWSSALEPLGEEEESPLLLVLWQSLYDLKASMFLALTAHYRGAAQLLRPALDNLVVGLYFQGKLMLCDSEEEVDCVAANWSQWINGDYIVPEKEWLEVTGKSEDERRKRLGFGFIVEWLKGKQMISGGDKQRLQEVWGRLNKYLHPHFRKMDISSEGCSSCPGTTAYDQNRYNEWLAIFQNVVDLTAKAVLTFFPSVSDTEKGREALSEFKNLEWQERELDIKAIACPYFRDFIRSLPNTDEPGAKSA